MRRIPYAGFHSHEINEPESIAPRQEELLSYLQGLAPVGEPVEVPWQWILDDLNISSRAMASQFFSKLYARGFIRRLAMPDRKGNCGVWVVARRLEAA